MTFRYPFYGRIFDICLKLKVGSWFSGQEKTASSANAIVFVSLHQLLLVFTLFDVFNSVINISVQLNAVSASLLAFGIIALNSFLLQKHHIVTKNNKYIDILSISIYLSTMIIMILYLMFPEAIAPRRCSTC